MATKKKATKKKNPSSGSDPKSKRIVAKKMATTMGQFKDHTLESGSGQKVTNPKQAKAIALSEARRAGARIPPSPNARPSAPKTSRKKR